MIEYQITCVHLRDNPVASYKCLEWVTYGLSTKSMKVEKGQKRTPTLRSEWRLWDKQAERFTALWHSGLCLKPLLRTPLSACGQCSA